MKIPDIKIIIVSAPSGAGKTTIVKRLLTSTPKLSFSISATTRSPRGNEVHGKDYYFLTPDEFNHHVNNNGFIEWEEVYPGRKYGTLKSEIERIASNGQYPIFDVDVQGGMKLKNLFGINALALFMRPPSLEVLEERLQKRQTDSESEIEMRLKKAIEELSYRHHFDHVITNESLDLASKQVQDLTYAFLNI